MRYGSGCKLVGALAAVLVASAAGEAADTARPGGILKIFHR